MPFFSQELRFDLACTRDLTGRWPSSISLSVDARALRRLGLHPDQPTSVVDGPPLPDWWHAAGERYARGRHRAVRRHAP